MTLTLTLTLTLTVTVMLVIERRVEENRPRGRKMVTLDKIRSRVFNTTLNTQDRVKYKEITDD